MAYVLIEGYLCERCGYRWGTRNGTGYRDTHDPGYCPKCKTKYWNTPRHKDFPVERQAKLWKDKVAEKANYA